MTTTAKCHTAEIARLNDAFRRHPGPDWMMTAGVQAKGPIFALAAVNAVRAFDVFTKGDNPYGERDFGAFDLGGDRLFWKIDYYDRELNFGSPDPSDPNLTRRVLTLMLAEEY